MITLRDFYQSAVEQVKELCNDGPERTVSLRLLEESLSCAMRCVHVEENPFLGNNITKRGKYMKKNPNRREKKMKDAGLTSPCQLHAKQGDN